MGKYSLSNEAADCAAREGEQNTQDRVKCNQRAPQEKPDLIVGNVVGLSRLDGSQRLKVTALTLGPEHKHAKSDEPA